MTTEACYIKIDRNGRRMLYGPLQQATAEKAGYLARSVGDRDAEARRPGANMGFWATHQYEMYTEDEIRALCAYPAEFGLKACRLIAKPAPIHKSWKEFSAESQAWMFNEDSRRGR